jgi:predicted GTPase
VPSRIVIMGAAGRDFHNFNTVFREDPESRIVAFTATQIPNIEGRRYPPELAGSLYPDGIPIHPESELPRLIRELEVDEVVFAYSDVSHETVMHRASLVLACGADFRLIGPKASMLKAQVPLVSVCAVRTGSGKSQTTRRVASLLRAKGRRVVAIRHPMPYGDLVRQKVQRFATMEDLDRHRCTIEEREEYEPHIVAGGVIYSGVDYARSSPMRRRRRTSSSGTAGTTTCRSTSRTSRSWWPTRTGRATRRPTTPGRRTSAGPT